MPRKKKTEKIEFKYKYVIPEHLRDLYVNGMWGGVTPRGEIHMHFYNERHAIPKSVTCEIDKKGEIKGIVSQEAGGDAARIVQASIVMDYQTAVAMRDWLNDRIGVIDKISKKNKEG